jgi:hypothetical protein
MPSLGPIERIIRPREIAIGLAMAFGTQGSVGLAAEAPAQPPESPDQQWLDVTRNHLARSLNTSAVWFDSFFGDRRSDEERARTLLRVTLESRYREDENFEVSPRVHADIRLPALDERLNLILSGRTEEDTLDPMTPDEGALIEPRREDDNPVDVGLRYTFAEELRQHTSLTAGLRVRAPIEPFVRGRYRYLRPLGEQSQLRFTQTLFWQDSEGVGETTRLDLEHRLQPGDLLRWTVSGLYSESSDGLEWRTGADWFRRLSGERALNLGLSVTAVTEPTAEVDTYRAHLRYRSNILRPWLFYEVEPELRWPRDEDYSPTPGIILRLEAQIGD